MVSPTMEAVKINLLDDTKVEQAIEELRKLWDLTLIV